MARASHPRFAYGGRSWEAPAGSSLLEALLTHDGLPTLGRSLRLRRRRAPFCGIGRCAGCLVRVNGRPGVPACRYVVTDGDRIESATGRPSSWFGLLGLLDTLGSRARGSVRGSRGSARTAQGSAEGYGPPRLADVDVAIVGHGRSGRAVAERLVARGARPLLLDDDLRRPELPGTERWAGAHVSDLEGPRPDGPPAFVLRGSLALGPAFSVVARRVVVATGAYDASLLFAGNDLPGVLTGDGALALARPGPRSVFRHAVVFGGDDRARELVDRLTHAVSAVVAPGAIGPDLVRSASALGIPLFPRTLLLEAHGRSRVRSVDLRSRGAGLRFSLPCDAVVLGHRRLPDVALLRQAGVTTAWDARSGSHRPVVAPDGATSVPGLYATGGAAGLPDGSGEANAEHLAEALCGEARAVTAPEASPWTDGPSELVGYYRELWRTLRRGRTIACRCEDVLLDPVVRAFERGERSVEALGRSTRLGAGPCGGRYCVPDTTVLLAALGRPRPAGAGSAPPATAGPRR